MVSRRTVLTGAVGAAVVGAVAAPTIASAGRQRVIDRDLPTGRTLAAGKESSDGHLRVGRADFPLSHLGVVWSGATARLRLRTPDGWGPWRTIAACGGAPDDHGRPGASTLVLAAGATGYELAASAGGATVVELNTTAAAGFSADPPAAGFLLPDGRACTVPYLSRHAWRADEGERFVNGVQTWPATYFPIQTLTVHHTAGTNNDPDPAATVRAIYHLQAITKGWGDIGYQLLIDESGRVYEGRVSGSDGHPAFGDLDTDGRPLMTNGAHVKGYNAGNIGVCLLGDYTSRQPTAAALSSLARVLSAFAASGRLAPTGTVAYRDPISGAARTVRTISGHRDWAPTDCPGDAYYPNLGLLRTTVAAAIRPDQPQTARPPRPRPTEAPVPGAVPTGSRGTPPPPRG